MTTQTQLRSNGEAERLADELEFDWNMSQLSANMWKAAVELRRLVSLNQQLMDEVARLNKAVADEREAMVAEAAKRGLAMKNEDPFEDYVRDIANDRARGESES